MMNTIQTKALTDAQPQPSASSRPNMARRRGTVVPAVSACCAIVLPSSPGRPIRSAVDHCAVRVPVMLACTLQKKVYAPAASGETSYVFFAIPGNVSPL